MAIMRYKCSACGIIVRTEEGADHVACACQAPYTAEPDEAPQAPVDPEVG